MCYILVVWPGRNILRASENCLFCLSEIEVHLEEANTLLQMHQMMTGRRFLPDKNNKQPPRKSGVNEKFNHWVNVVHFFVEFSVHFLSMFS